MMDKSTKDHASAIHVALFIFPKIMREMINNKWSPKDVIKRIEIDKGQIFMNKLTQEAKSMIANMKRNGYFALDVCCLYQVIRYFNLLSSPKQGWGVNPKADDKRKADDVERMKILRNNIIHCPQGGLSESDRKKFFEQSIDIAERMDKRNGSPVNGFKSEIEKVQIDSVSIASQENFEKCPKYQGKLQITTDKRYVSLYYGNDIMMKIDAQNDQENVTKKEVTVAIIKPDAVKAGKVDQILENIREAGIIILLQKEIKFTEEDIKQLYLHLQDQDFFKDLVQFMTSDISHVLVLTKGKSGENIIEEFKDLIGPSDIIEATTKKPNSLRAKYGQHTFRNALHGSYSSEMAKRELASFFPDFVVPSLESKPDKLQTTLALLRPEAFRLYKEKILTKICELGFKVAMQREVLLTREKAEEFYKEQKDKEYFEQFIKIMTSDSVLALGLSRKNAIREWRQLLGPKEVSKAKNEAPESLRAQFAVHDTINSLHGSDSEETAKKELQLFFPLEETVAVIKPDAEGHKDEIVDKIHEAGFKIVDRKETILSREIAEKLYVSHQHEDYYIDLIEHMTSGPTYFLVLLREDAVKGLRSLIGPTDPKQAKEYSPDSIRAIYGESKLKNAVNGSSDLEHAKKTIKTIFGERSSACILYLRDSNIDVNAVLQKIDDIKESIRTGNYQMKDCIDLTDIKLGSLILHVTIPLRCFMTKEILHKTLQSFFCQFFKAASIQSRSGHNFTVVLAESDFLFAESTNRDDLDYLNETPFSVLKLNVSVKDSAFQSKLVLHREVSGFIAGMYNTINRDNVPVNGSARDVLMLADNENTPTPSSERNQDSELRMAHVAVVSERESNYFKISTLLLRISPRAVRIKFDDLIHPEDLRDTLSSNLSKLTALKDKRCINQMQWNSMFPRTDDPTSQSFDTTLMIVLFKNLAEIQIGNKLPPPTDISVGADLARIKTYRKNIANSKDRTFENENFAAIWNETEAAVIRLSGGKLTSYCSNLKTKKYDVADSKKNHALIKDDKKLVRIEEINEVADRVEKIDFKQKSSKTRDCFNKDIEEWEEETKRFVHTNAYHFILKHLHRRIFTVVGNPGMGKSMLIQQIALSLRNSAGYSIFPCKRPSDIVSQFSKETKQIFILDDACGRFTLVQSYIERWKQYEMKIIKLLEKTESIILASCRSQVFREQQCQSLIVFSVCVCDLNDEECAIDTEQKLNIAEQYLSQTTISEIKKDLNNFDMFPLLCRLYKDSQIQKPVSFFKDPFSFYKAELDNFCKEGDGIKCCSLFLIVLHSGCLNQAILTNEFESDFSKTLETIFEKFGLSPTISHQSIIECLDTLNTYIEKRNEHFNVLHDRLFDFLCYYFGQHYQQLIINYADSEIIRDRTLLKSLRKGAYNFTILIDEEYENEYIERLIKDMLCGYIDDVLYNPQIFHKVFRYKLLFHLQQLDDDDVTVTRVLSEFVSDKNENTSQLLPVNFACKYGYKELFEFFLSKTEDVNAYSGNNIPLITACRKKDRFMTRLLLDKGADVNQTDSLGCTPLLWSCVYGNLDIIQMLIAKDTDVNKIELRSKSSPLMWACVGEFIQLLESRALQERLCSSSQAEEFISFVMENEQFFSHERIIDSMLTILEFGYKGGISIMESIAKDTQPNIQHIISMSIKLINTLKGGNIENDACVQSYSINQSQPFIEIMNLFIEIGVDIDKSSSGGLTALSLASVFCFLKEGQSIQYLLSKGASVNKPDTMGIYPLSFAIEFEREDLVKLFIEHGAIVNYAVQGYNPLLLAAINKQNIYIVDSLIAAKADINACQENESTLLHYAIELNNAGLISTLVKGGISVNCKDRLGNTPLMLAVIRGLTKTVTALLKEGAIVNTWNSKKISPLMVASLQGEYGIVEMILEKKEEVTKYHEPLLFACLNNHSGIVGLLLQSGWDVNYSEPIYGNTLLLEASEKGLQSMVCLLLEKEANVNASNHAGDTPLTVASLKGHPSIVRLLIAEKADMYHTNKNNVSSLFIACLHNKLDVVEVLINHGYYIDSIDKEKKQTCLSVASYHAYDKIVAWFIEHGSNVNTKSYIGNTPLMLAASKGHLDIVRILIENKASVNIRNEKGSTSLSFASSKGFPEIVTYLVQHKANTNTQNNTGNTPLILAAFNSFSKIVKILIENKADLNIRNDKGSTCLSVASSKGFDNIVTYLINQRASIDTTNNTGDSPLMLASRNGHLSTVKILLENGAKVDAQNHAGDTALLIAAMNNDTAIIQILIASEAKMNTLNKYGESSLILACLHNNLDIMKVLFDNGCKIESFEKKQKQTCLSLASYHGYDKIASYLIKHGASVNAQNYEGDTPLMLAALEGHLNIVKQLIEHKANVNVRNGNGSTCLSLVSRKGFDNILTYLIDKRASIETVNNTGDSPLILASKNGHLSTVKILLENRAKVYASNHAGDTALITAAMNNDTAIVQTLIASEAKMNTLNKYGESSLILACLHNNLEVMKVLIDNGCKIESLEKKQKQTCLSLASYHGYDKIASYLIKHGANVNAQDYKGDTPLMLAAFKGHLNIVKQLIEHKANVNVRNGNGSTCLSLVSRKGFDNILTYLIDKRASIETINNTGDSPLILASNNGHLSTVKILLENGAKVDASNHAGNTPLIMSAMNNDTAIIQILIASEAEMYKSKKYGESSLILACRNNRFKVVKLLIDNGCNIESFDMKKKQTCLSVASYHGHYNLASYLIEQGANVNAQNNKGHTPLMIATTKGHFNIAKLLMENKANVNIRNENGSTCLLLASSAGFKRVVTYLIDKGASIDTANNTGDSPLMLASKNGHLSTVKILLENGAKVDMKNKKGLSSIDFARQKKYYAIEYILCCFTQSRSNIRLYVRNVIFIAMFVFLLWLYCIIM